MLIKHSIVIMWGWVKTYEITIWLGEPPSIHQLFLCRVPGFWPIITDLPRLNHGFLGGVEYSVELFESSWDAPKWINKVSTIMVIEMNCRIWMHKINNQYTQPWFKISDPLGFYLVQIFLGFPDGRMTFKITWTVFWSNCESGAAEWPESHSRTYVVSHFPKVWKLLCFSCS
jgi:hypothetical protein